MTDKLIKYSSRQGGPFDSSTNNLIDFDIPADGSYDFTDSYVALVSAINDVAAPDLTAADGYNLNVATRGPTDGRKNFYHDNNQNSAPVGGVFRTNVGWKANPDQPIYNVAVVKNCNLNTALKGSLEDVRRVDIFRNNLNEYTLSAAEKKSLQYNSLRQLGTTGCAKFSIFQEINKIGSQPSLEKDAIIKLPMSQLFELGKLNNYPADKLGKTRVHLELNLDKLAVLDSVNMSRAAQIFRTAASAAVAASPLPTKLDLALGTNVEESPFHISQVVLVGFEVEQNADGNNSQVGSLKEQRTQLVSNGQAVVGNNLTLIATNDGQGLAKSVLIRTVAIDAGQTQAVLLITGAVLGQQQFTEVVTFTAGDYANNKVKVTTNKFSSVTSIQVFSDNNFTVSNTTAFNVGFQGCIVAEPAIIGPVGTALVLVPAIINSIEYDKPTLSLNVSYNSAPNITSVANCVVANDGKIGVCPLGPDVSDASLQVKHSEIVLRKLNAAPAAPSKLNYMAITTEQFTGQPQQYFQRMFQLEPQAVNVYIMFDHPDVNDIQSVQDNIKEFRLRLDNEDLTDRQVLAQLNNSSKFRSPLYYDRIAMTLLNGNYQLKSLVEDIQGVVKRNINQTLNSRRITMIANPVPVSQSEKMLQLNIETSDENGVGKMVLFKQVIRAVNL